MKIKNSLKTIALSFFIIIFSFTFVNAKTVLRTDEAAIAITSSAGGVDIDAATNKDVNIAGGQVTLVSKDDTASAISLTTDIGTSETIAITNTKGTSAAAINMEASAGGVLMSADGNVADAIKLHATTGTSQTINVLNTAGTGDAAIALTSSAGGVAITGKNSTLTMATAGDIALTANNDNNDTITVTNTQGTGDDAIALTSTAGGITMKVADEKNLTLSSDDSNAYIKVAPSANPTNEVINIVNT